MNFSRFPKTIYLVALVSVIALSGCLNDNGSQISSDVRFGMQVNDFDSTLVSGNDSLRIERVRFVYGDGAVVINGDTSIVLQSSSDWLQFGVTQSSNNPIPMFRANSGTFHSFILSVQKAPLNNSNIDPDFTEDTRHSMIIEGKFNNTDFTYKMDRAFKTDLPISPAVEVPQYNASYTFLISTNLKDWFTNEGQSGFYNPKTADDTTSINDNIEHSFSIESINNAGGF